MKRRAAACKLLIAALVTGVVVGWASEARAELRCGDGVSAVSCTDPQALTCADEVYYHSGESGSNRCESVGFTDPYPGLWYLRQCPNGTRGCGAATVSTLEAYAAAAFLVLTLAIAWDVRRRSLPSS